MGCKGGRWIELALDRVQWQSLVLVVFKLCVLLPESLFVRWFKEK